MSYLVTVELAALKNSAAIEKFCQRQNWKYQQNGQTMIVSPLPGSRGSFSIDLNSGRLNNRIQQLDKFVEKMVTGRVETSHGHEHGANYTGCTDEFNRCAFMAMCEENKISYIEQTDGSITVDVETPEFQPSYL